MTGKPDAPTSSENWKPAAYAYRKGDTSFNLVSPGQFMSELTFERLEPREVNVSCVVLRGETGREARDLPGYLALHAT